MLTPNDLQNLIRGLSATFATKEDINKLEEKFDLKFDNVMTKMDQVYTAVVATREENAAHILDHERIEERLNDIESVPTIAHHIRGNKK